MRVCIGNFLMFISLYMLFPVAPLEMAERLQVPVAHTGTMFLMLTAGMLLVGPFHAYIIDAFKRKFVCSVSFLGMLVATFAYYYVDSLTQLLMLCAVQGIFAGLGTTAAVALAIDSTQSSMRSHGNIAFSWMVRLGMFCGIALGVWVYQWYSFYVLILAALALGVIGLLFITRLYSPFRAPLVTKVCSTDRFILKRGWIPAINLVGIAAVPGLLLPVYSHHGGIIDVLGLGIPSFAFVALGFPLALMIYRLCFVNDKTFMAITTGLILMLFALLFLDFGSGFVVPLILGLGLGLVAPEFLMLFIKLSEHCQRGTVNTTHFLAWELGITGGIAWSCYLYQESGMDQIFLCAKIMVIVSLLFYLIVTHPYFRHKRIR